MKWTAVFAVVAALVRLAPAETRDACPAGWVNLNDETEPASCVYFKRTHDTWSATKTYCDAIGGNLAKLTGSMHQKILQRIGDDTETFWLGGSDESVEGNWIWVNDGTSIPLGPPHWLLCIGEPQGGTRKNCLCLFPPEYYFRACTCDHTYSGICQI